MSTHDCLNNEDQLDSVLDEVAQIDSEFDSVSDIDSDLEKVVEVIIAPFESISVNGEHIEPDENKNVNIEIPTKTSGFENDGDGTSPYATEDFVETNGGKIDSISIDGVNQTIDENKNVDLKGLASTEFVEGKIQKLIGLAPETLDTLEEIANELGENETALNSLTNKITEVENKIPLAGEGLNLDDENKLNVSPSLEETFGGLRVWEEFGYLHLSTEPYVPAQNERIKNSLVLRISQNSYVDGDNLIIN